MSELRGIGQIAISVTDLARQVAFYRDVLGLTFLFEVPGQNMAFLQAGSVRLYLDGNDTSAPGQVESRPVLYFDVESVQGTFDELVAKGVEVLGEPHVVNRTDAHELWMAFFKDPEGTVFALMAEVPIS